MTATGLLDRAEKAASARGRRGPTTGRPDAPKRSGAVVRRWLPLALAGVLLSASAAAFWASSRPVTYTATAIVRIDGSPQGSAEVALTRPQLEARRLDFEAADARRTVESALGVSSLGAVSASLDLDNALVTLAVTSDSAAIAVAGAGGLVEEVATRSRADQIRELQRELEQNRVLFEENDQLLSVRVAELDRLRGAGLDDEAAALERLMWHTSNRRTFRDQQIAALEADIALATGRVVIVDIPSAATENRADLLAYAIGGAAVGIAVGAILLSQLARPGRRLHSIEELAEITDLPLLATIPRLPKAHSSRASSMVAGQPTAPQAAEAFRFARTAVGIAAAGRRARIIAVTSAEPEVGKTVVTANLAAAGASGGAKVLVVDGDLLSSTSAEALGLHAAVNTLPHVLAERDIGWPISTVDLASGVGVDLMARTDLAAFTEQRPEIASSDVRRLFDASTSDYDMTLVDCPPVLAVADSIPLSVAADAAVIVVRLGRTRHRELAETLERLDRADAAVLGIIATHVPDADSLATYDLTSAQPAQDQP